MVIIADKFGSADNFSAPLIEAIGSMSNGDTLELSNKVYHLYRDFSENRNIHMTNTDSFKNPIKYFGVLLEGLEDITIEGNGATLCIHGDMCSIAVLNCKNVKLKDFTIKYENPSNAEMVVKAVKGRTVTYDLPKTMEWRVDGKDVFFSETSPFSKGKYWEFKNDENSWNSVCHSNLDVFRTLHFKAPFSKVKEVKALSNSELSIKYKTKRKFKIGDAYTFSQNKNRNTCGVFVSESENVSAENIEVNYLPGFGWLSQMCKDVRFTNVKFKPCENRHVSAFADLIHVCGCKGSVIVDNCYFSHPHDDAINIHGAFLRFKEKIDNNTAVFEFVHNQQGGYKAFFEGDKVQLYYRSNLQELGTALTVKNSVDDIDNKLVTVTFNEALPADIEARKLNQSNVVCENISYCPNVEIKNSEFTAIPTRGILCSTAGKVRIHNNKFTNVAMAHIFISNDAADWYESGPCRDVEIYSNKFFLNPTKQYEQLNAPAVLVKPITLGRRVTKPIHKNIKIYCNYIQVGRDKAVKAIGVDGIDVYGNVIEGSKRIVLRRCKK